MARLHRPDGPGSTTGLSAICISAEREGGITLAGLNSLPGFDLAHPLALPAGKVGKRSEKGRKCLYYDIQANYYDLMSRPVWAGLAFSKRFV
jgi:hypothetical protein